VDPTSQISLLSAASVWELSPQAPPRASLPETWKAPSLTCRACCRADAFGGLPIHSGPRGLRQGPTPKPFTGDPLIASPRLAQPKTGSACCCFSRSTSSPPFPVDPFWWTSLAPDPQGRWDETILQSVLRVKFAKLDSQGEDPLHCGVAKLPPPISFVANWPLQPAPSETFLAEPARTPGHCQSVAGRFHPCNLNSPGERQAPDRHGCPAGGAAACFAGPAAFNVYQKAVPG